MNNASIATTQSKMQELETPISFNANDCAPQGLAQPSALHTGAPHAATACECIPPTAQDVQAAKRNTCADTQRHSPMRTSPPQEESEHARTMRSQQQAGHTEDTNDAICAHGGQKESARSYDWLPVQEGIYDPDLGRHSIPVVEDTHLMEHIVEDSNFMRALVKINREPKKACGCDGKRVRDVCGLLLESAEAREAIRKELLDGTYKVDEVLSKQIPKHDGKMRTLGIATVKDRIVQTMINQSIEDNLPKGTWNPHSYAYLPNRGTKDAIAEVDVMLKEGYEFGIQLDLKAFFDNVPHSRLIRKLRAHIRDERVVKLVVDFLTPVIRDDTKGTKVINRKGTPQGSVISPWLASMLYLDELDKELTLRGRHFVRYADDVTVFCRSRKAAKRVAEKLIDFVERTMECPVNREKTKIVDIHHISLLGVRRENGKWYILEDREKSVREKFLLHLRQYLKTMDVYELDIAAATMRGFVEAYIRIKGIARAQIKTLKRWSGLQWIKLLRDVKSDIGKRKKAFLLWCKVKERAVPAAT